MANAVLPGGEVDLLQKGKGRPLSAKAMPFVPGRSAGPAAPVGPPPPLLQRAPVEPNPRARTQQQQNQARTWTQIASHILSVAHEQHVVSEKHVDRMRRQLAEMNAHREMDNKALMHDLNSISTRVNQLGAKVSMLAQQHRHQQQQQQQHQHQQPTTVPSPIGFGPTQTPPAATSPDHSFCSLEKELGLSITGDITPTSRYTGADNEAYLTPAANTDEDNNASGFIMSFAHSSSPDTSLDDAPMDASADDILRGLL